MDRVRSFGLSRPGVARGVKYAVLYATLLAGLISLHTALADYACDDAYIHFRIAKNLATSGEPYFNKGEAVMASSSQGWTLLLGLLFRVVGIGPILVANLNALILAAGTFACARILSSLSGFERGGIYYDLLAALVYVPLMMQSSLELMETPTAVLCLFAGSYCVLSKKMWGFCFLCCASFFRPELIVFVFFNLIFHFCRNPRDLRPLLWCGIGSAPFIAYQVYFFGTVIPHPIFAKAVVYDLSARRALYEVKAGLMPFIVGGRIESIVRLACIGLLLLAVARDLTAHDRKNAYVQWCWFLPGLFIAGSYVVARVFLHPWYVPLYSVPIVMAATATGLRHKSKGLLLLVALLLAPSAINLAKIVWASSGNPMQLSAFEDGARVRQYLRVGHALFAKYPHANLMSSEIGGLGFAFEGKIFDAVGLIDPAALKYHPMKVPEQRPQGVLGAIPSAYVAEVKPDIIVSLDCFLQDLLQSHVVDDYVRQKFPKYIDSDMKMLPREPDGGLEHLNVFLRKDSMALQQ